MWDFLCVCIIGAFICRADGQDTNSVCKGVKDFDHCPVTWTCDTEVSQCFCKSETPYCRCNNYIDEFYLGKSCSQKWTALSFALVATLPGVALAFMIGLSVHLAHRFGKSSKSQGAGNELTHIPEQNLFPGVVFASDLPSRPPPGPTPEQMGVLMASSQPYSVSDYTQFLPGGPPKGAPRPPMAAPRPQYSLPPSSPTLSRPEQQPYSSTGAHVFSNPYARARNPYEEIVSTEPYNRAASSQPYEQRMAPPPAPSYGAPQYHSAFPQAQISRPY